MVKCIIVMSIQQPLQIVFFNNVEECSQDNGAWKEQDIRTCDAYDHSYGNISEFWARKAVACLGALSGILWAHLRAWLLFLQVPD